MGDRAEIGKPCLISAREHRKYNNLDQVEDILLEKISGSVELGITFCPCIHDRYKPSKLIDMVEQCLNSMKRTKYSISFMGEFSESGRFHLHGIIKGEPKVINKIKRKLNETIGRTEIKPIRHEIAYFWYMLKSVCDYTGNDKKPKERFLIKDHELAKNMKYFRCIEIGNK